MAFVIAGPARSNRSGLLLYTNACRDAQPFQGGILCLKTPPLRRGGRLSQTEPLFWL